MVIVPYVSGTITIVPYIHKKSQYLAQIAANSEKRFMLSFLAILSDKETVENTAIVWYNTDKETV